VVYGYEEEWCEAVQSIGGSGATSRSTDMEGQHKEGRAEGAGPVLEAEGRTSAVVDLGLTGQAAQQVVLI
jgi:hypothetical protein